VQPKKEPYYMQLVTAHIYNIETRALEARSGYFIREMPNTEFKGYYVIRIDGCNLRLKPENVQF